jgi:hypothetical protein
MEWTRIPEQKELTAAGSKDPRKDLVSGHLAPTVKVKSEKVQRTGGQN